jgi:formylglycine-generating enzyme required for sulfatase activity
VVDGKDKWRYCSPVGSFEANGYGLFDMAGNLSELCADRYGEDYYSKSPAKNPLGPDTGKYLVIRGGDWYADKRYLRVAYRNFGGLAAHGGDPLRGRAFFIGFRCVIDVDSNGNPKLDPEGKVWNGH